MELHKITWNIPHRRPTPWPTAEYDVRLSSEMWKDRNVPEAGAESLRPTEIQGARDGLSHEQQCTQNM